MTIFHLEDLEQDAESLAERIARDQNDLDAVRTVIELLRDKATTTRAEDAPDPPSTLAPKYPPRMPGVAPPPYLKAEPKEPNAGPPPGMPGVDPTRMPGLSPHEFPGVRRVPKTQPAVGELRGVADPWELVVDFTATFNMLDRLRRIGRAAEGQLLSAGLVSRFLLDVGESRGSMVNVRRDVGSCMADHPEHFESVERGVYRYHDSPRFQGGGDSNHDR